MRSSASTLWTAFFLQDPGELAVLNMGLWVARAFCLPAGQHLAHEPKAICCSGWGQSRAPACYTTEFWSVDHFADRIYLGSQTQCTSEPIPFFSPPFVSGHSSSVKVNDLQVRLTAVGREEGWGGAKPECAAWAQPAEPWPHPQWTMHPAHPLSWVCSVIAAARVSFLPVPLGSLLLPTTL